MGDSVLDSLTLSPVRTLLVGMAIALVIFVIAAACRQPNRRRETRHVSVRA
jgi:hypothetical protein